MRRLSQGRRLSHGRRLSQQDQINKVAEGLQTPSQARKSSQPTISVTGLNARSALVRMVEEGLTREDRLELMKTIDVNYDGIIQARELYESMTGAHTASWCPVDTRTGLASEGYCPDHLGGLAQHILKTADCPDNSSLPEDLRAEIEQVATKLLESTTIDRRKMTFPDFLVLLCQRRAAICNANPIRDLYKEYDANGNEGITAEEIKVWLNEHGKHVTLSDAKRIIQQMDLKDDGNITYDNFLILITARLLTLTLKS